MGYTKNYAQYIGLPVFFNTSFIKQSLSDNEIHLWSLAPQKITDQTQLDALKKLLSPDEIQKVQRYKLPKAQNNALITRAFIRSVLALYTDQQPQDLAFTITEHGKPELSNSPIPLRFNLSHNNALIICAVCLTYDIGCDIESLQRKITIESIAKRYFSTPEYQSLQALNPTEKQTRFFEYWTLKEAFVKAKGVGISFGLDKFSFHIEKSTAEPEKIKFNDNIDLTFYDEKHLKNQQDWYNCLTYPDQTHCIAICVDRKSPDNKWQIKYIQADNL